jgi:hypothetical protein
MENRKILQAKRGFGKNGERIKLNLRAMKKEELQSEPTAF